MTGPAVPPPAGENRFSFMVRALKYRNYRLYFGGQIVSLVGNWMTSIATSWLVYRLTGSAWMLGVVGFAGQIPAFLLAPFAGIVVDRVNKHRLLVITQTLAMLQSFSLAAMTLSGHATIAGLIVLNVIDGIITAFDMPLRQSFVIEMIEKKEDLGNAIALNSSMVNAARLIGPSLGGVIIALAGEGWCFFLDGASFLAVIFALLAMKVRAVAPRPRHAGGPLAEMREGWDYASSSVPIRSIIALLALVSLVGVPYTVLIPLYAGKILNGGPHTLGLMMTATGTGAFAAAVWLASRKSVLGLGRVIPISAAAFGVGLIAFAYSTTLWLSVPLLLLTGAGFMTQMASSNTIVQTIVDDDKRGRVMSLFMMAFLGTAPFGSLLAGSMAERFGAPNTLAFGGICCAAGALWFARGLEDLRAAIRPIYRRMGILPQVASAVEASGRLTFETRD
ncbi:MAG TPA: MFS transporter [Elusimicrobiota bacterium]|nr:MFS transporter [Elusimicrobiota bacterium]